MLEMQYWEELSCSSKFNPLVFFFPPPKSVLNLAKTWSNPVFGLCLSMKADIQEVSACRHMRAVSWKAFIRFCILPLSCHKSLTKYGSFFFCLSPPHPPPLWIKTQQQPGKWQRQFSSLAKDMNHERFPRQPWAVKEWKQSGCWDLPPHSIKAAGRY